MEGIKQKKQRRGCEGLFTEEFKSKCDLGHTNMCGSGGHCDSLLKSQHRA